MSKFHKGDIVYRACLAEFDGKRYPIAILAKVAVVCPQRDGSTTYILHNFDGMPRSPGAVWSTTGAAEDTLHADPLEAMIKAVAAIKPGAVARTDACQEAVAHV
jgi:hypothetical protein